MTIGVLALQGAFREHKQAFNRLKIEVVEVRLPEDLEGLQGLVIPGGESSTMAKLMKTYALDSALGQFYEQGGALWGTCAGAIALAKRIIAFPEQDRLGLMDIAIERNAYGRQVNSFEADLMIQGFKRPFRGVFIRSPRIVELGEDVKVLAHFQNSPVMLSQDRLLATVFHPELKKDDRIHRYFLEHIVHHQAVS